MSSGVELDPASMPYRACVGIVLLNRDGLIWIGRRFDQVDKTVENWQMPQGGIDPEEDPAQAALRELAEETGTDKASILARSRDLHRYDLPPHLLGVALKGIYRGQEQTWFALRFLGEDVDFNIEAPAGGHEPEFDAWRWATASEVLALIAPFKRPVYQAVLEEFRHLLNNAGAGQGA
jgi:putative (di)nucleoside polyphosphate hydrolase